METPTESGMPSQAVNTENGSMPSTNPFDPLVEIVGMRPEDGSSGNAAAGMGREEAQYLQYANGMGSTTAFARAGKASADATTAERVAAVKATLPPNFSSSMNAPSTSFGMSQQAAFGVAGANMHIAANPHLNAYSHAQQMQMQAQWAQQQQAMMQMYSTFNLGAGAATMQGAYGTQMGQPTPTMQNMQPSQMPPSHNQLVVYQPSPGMNDYGGMPMGPGHNPAAYNGYSQMPTALVPYGMQPSPIGGPSSNNLSTAVPAMKADQVYSPAPSDFRVKRGTKPVRVNDDDRAFGPLLDELKALPSRSANNK